MDIRSLLVIMNNANVNIQLQDCVNMSSFLWSVYLRVKLLGIMVMFRILTTQLISKVAVLLYNIRWLQFPHGVTNIWYH